MLMNNPIFAQLSGEESVRPTLLTREDVESDRVTMNLIKLSGDALHLQSPVLDGASKEIHLPAARPKFPLSCLSRTKVPQSGSLTIGH
ncbi:hypothetical protein CVT25_008051 [Psilocybe cyanescens]|uniref:Uncharacterized protein n=1 Tax=Psilocybe cyanescens TaxID=93625 RepID=A0A409XGE4_PSICY|nr:hypothetical protein CVT25_008051 [Psilocybe cyanescens]